ncbi:heterokaryon incompatibility protein-domain-containing protein, partial [Bisporella sp. PMI_857]
NSTGSDYATAMIGYWLRECIHRHPKCRGTIESLPTRVLDVGEEGDSQEPFLFVSEGKTAPYIAMSHCWGKSPMATTTQENLQNRLKVITLSELPKSFRDAIQTCRKLGVRYLWVDSLCIIQNSTKDWQQEASKMGSVYKNAILTIAAVSAKDSTEGCFMSRDAGKMYPCWSLMTGDTSMEDSSKYLWIRPQRDALSIVYLQLRHMGGPLDSRAWVLQEKILARRTIYYHKDMLYFECLTMEASEQVPEGI